MLNPVHVPYGRRIQEPHFAELGDVRNLDPHLGILRLHPAQGLRQVEADPVDPVAVGDHAVGAAAACAAAPFARGDDQLAALLGGQVVLQYIAQDGPLTVV